MAKQQIEIKQVVSDLEKLFEIGERTAENQSMVSREGKKFLIDKRKFERLQVIDMLQEYFADKVIKGGYLEVSLITLVFTTFEIKEGHSNIEN